MAMRPYDHNGRLHISGYDSRDRRSRSAKHRTTEFSEDQDIIQRQIYKDRHYAGDHRHHRLAALPQSADICLLYGKRKQSEANDPKILFAAAQRLLYRQSLILSLKIHRNQIFSKEGQDQNTSKSDQCGNIKLKAERMPDPLVILFPIKLRRKDPRARYRAKNSQIVNQQQLIDNGNAGHLLRPDLPHHDIIQQTHKIGDPVLDHNGNRYSQRHPVKLLRTKIFLSYIGKPGSDSAFFIPSYVAAFITYFVV